MSLINRNNKTDKLTLRIIITIYDHLTKTVLSQYVHQNTLHRECSLLEEKVSSQYFFHLLIVMNDTFSESLLRLIQITSKIT